MVRTPVGFGGPAPEAVQLGKRLKDAREYVGITQEETATHLKVRRSAISEMEAEKRGVGALESRALRGCISVRRRGSPAKSSRRSPRIWRFWHALRTTYWKTIAESWPASPGFRVLTPRRPLMARSVARDTGLRTGYIDLWRRELVSGRPMAIALLISSAFYSPEAFCWLARKPETEPAFSGSGAKDGRCSPKRFSRTWKRAVSGMWRDILGWSPMPPWAPIAGPAK